MNAVDLHVNDRVEVRTAEHGRWWGYVVSVDGDAVTLDDLSPKNRPSEVKAADIRQVLWNGRPPRRAVGLWVGYSPDGRRKEGGEDAA